MISVRLLDDPMSDKTVDVAAGEDGQPPATVEVDVRRGARTTERVTYVFDGYDAWGIPEYRAIDARV